MRGGSLLLFFLLLFYFFPSPPIRSGEVFSSVIFFSSLSLLLFVFFGCSDGMEREACVRDHGFERSDLCAEIINNNNNNTKFDFTVDKGKERPKSCVTFLLCDPGWYVQRT